MDNSLTNQRVDRVLFIWLFMAGLLGVLAGIPWSISVLNDTSAVLWSSLVELLLFITPASGVGVWLGRKVSLGYELRELVSGMPGGWRHVRLGLVPAIIVGVILGAIGYFAQSSMPDSALIPELSGPNTFEWSLRCLSAALTEEIFFRFGLMIFFVWMIKLIIRKPAFRTSSLWFGNLLSAIAFAAGHLTQLTPDGWSFMIPLFIFSTSVGMIMGWLFMRYGLVSAIIAHFIADLIVYVVPRLVAIIV